MGQDPQFTKTNVSKIVQNGIGTTGNHQIGISNHDFRGRKSYSLRATRACGENIFTKTHLPQAHFQVLSIQIGMVEDGIKFWMD